MTNYTKPVSEEELNARAKDLGTARVTLEAIEKNIACENYFTAAEGAANAGTPVPASLELLTFCVLTLQNGYTVTGQSACADPANFDREIGKKIARGDAIRQIWPLMGYELRTKLKAVGSVTDDTLGEALTRMTAASLGNTEAFRSQDADRILAYFKNENSEEGGLSGN
jgi:hypothetical protein